MRQNYFSQWVLFSFMVSLLALSGCASIAPKGKTDQEKVAFIQKYEDETLAKLKEKHPESVQALAECEGYAVLHQGVSKIPWFGAGSGYGVVVDKQDKQRSYLSISRFDVGAGLGVREFDVVLIFTQRKPLEDMMKGKWHFAAGVDAAANVDQKGATAQKTDEKGAVAEKADDSQAKAEKADDSQAEAKDGAVKVSEGVKGYSLAGSGIAATATARIIHLSVKKYKIEKE